MFRTVPLETQLGPPLEYPLAEPESLVERARGYASGSRAGSTLRAYRASWRAYAAWCARHGVEPREAGPRECALYVTHLADLGRAWPTIQRAVSAIRIVLRRHQGSDPLAHEAVREVLAGIRRATVSRPREASPIRASELLRMLEHVPFDRRGLRDRAYLLIGWCGALRRSELVGLDVADLEETVGGIVLHLRGAKTGAGQVQQVAIVPGESEATCPVTALRAWLDAARVVDGPVFREVRRGGLVTEHRASSASVCRAVQRYAAAAGLEGEHYSAHSLRAGLITDAVARGVPEADVMSHSRHKSVLTFRRYVRRVTAFDRHPAKGAL